MAKVKFSKSFSTNLKLFLPIILIFCIGLFIVLTIVFISSGNSDKTKNSIMEPELQVQDKITQSVSSASATPTKKPLSFQEAQKLYGPCTILPTLFYHHIQSQATAKAKGQQSLTVYTDNFDGQMQYLKQHGYNSLSMQDLVNFFNGQGKIPPKSVLITFDDGYIDLYTNVFPILKQYGLKATSFLPTGLVSNPDYVNWDQVMEMNASGVIYFANHTWSHKSVAGSIKEVSFEISTADTQLNQRGLNTSKVFAYPYGTDSITAENYLRSIGYNLAFTTHSGNILCKAQNLSLPRVRIGNSQLNRYGF